MGRQLPSKPRAFFPQDKSLTTLANNLDEMSNLVLGAGILRHPGPKGCLVLRFLTTLTLL